MAKTADCPSKTFPYFCSEGGFSESMFTADKYYTYQPPCGYLWPSDYMWPMEYEQKCAACVLALNSQALPACSRSPPTSETPWWLLWDHREESRAPGTAEERDQRDLGPHSHHGGKLSQSSALTWDRNKLVLLSIYYLSPSPMAEQIS